MKREMVKGKIPGGLTFTVDISNVEKWADAWKKFPWEAGKWLSTMLNDMAFDFRRRFPEVIASRYTVRDKKFIKAIIRVERARPSRTMKKITATVGTLLGSSGRGGEESLRFSGFSEELTGKPGVGQPHWRTILPAGRVGGTMAGIAEDWARLHPNQYIPSIEDPRLQNVPEDRRFAAMIDMMTRGKMEHSPSNVFILKGGKYKKGLYRFKGGKTPNRKQFKEGKKQVDRIQAFGDKSKPIMPPMWDWKELTMEKVKEKFTPDYMYDNYIARVFTGMTPTEFFKGGK
jgi:hypothetical protein